MTDKEVLITIIKQSGECNRPIYCHCSHITNDTLCPLLDKNTRDCVGRRAEIYDYDEVKKIIHKKAVSLFIEKFGDMELLEAIL